MPRTSGRPVLVCPGFFTDTASWAGVPLKYLIESAGVKPGATSVRLIGADKYTVSLSMDVAMASGNFPLTSGRERHCPNCTAFRFGWSFPASKATSG